MGFKRNHLTHYDMSFIIVEFQLDFTKWDVCMVYFFRHIHKAVAKSDSWACCICPSVRSK